MPEIEHEQLTQLRAGQGDRLLEHARGLEFARRHVQRDAPPGRRREVGHLLQQRR
ncbi:MAG: hypothetical protein U1F07_16155 [Rubrivivax sp.]